jgi:hypothetical protein
MPHITDVFISSFFSFFFIPPFICFFYLIALKVKRRAVALSDCSLMAQELRILGARWKCLI